MKPYLAIDFFGEALTLTREGKLSPATIHGVPVILDTGYANGMFVRAFEKLIDAMRTDTLSAGEHQHYLRVIKSLTDPDSDKMPAELTTRRQIDDMLACIHQHWRRFAAQPLTPRNEFQIWVLEDASNDLVRRANAHIEKRGRLPGEPEPAYSRG